MRSKATTSKLREARIPVTAPWIPVEVHEDLAACTRPRPARDLPEVGLDPGVAYIAHEITQPLTAIQLNAEAALEWLLKDGSDVVAAKRALERIIGNVMRARRVVNSIRDLSRANPTRMSDLDIARVVQDMVHLADSELERHGIVVELALAPALPTVEGDRCQLERVIANLLSNAIEAMCSTQDWQRTLRISVQPEGSVRVHVMVEDSGPGIAPENIDRIFDPLFTTKRDGVGLGLSICRSIAEAHGGHLSARPNLPSGSVFRLVVPCRRR